MSIQWFPGHMTKAFREIKKTLSQVDMVIEIRDARVVLASENPLIAEIVGMKPRLIILSKSDLADPIVTQEWIEQLRNETTKVVALDFLHDNLNIVTEKAKELMSAKIERQIRRGIKPRAIRAMIVGIPNVGKSTLINRLNKKKIVKVADRPGVTKALRWIKINKELDLLDTPGVLWPKFEDPLSGKLLAVTGAINDKILDLEILCNFAYDFIMSNYPNILTQRYGPLPIDSEQGLLAIGKVRHFLIRDGIIDLERVRIVFLDEMRGQYGKGISWQKPV
ncbi:MAG: ribosome biogenesis GTPase YlqF [Erysipelotrichaceae bacterium]